MKNDISIEDHQILESWGFVRVETDETESNKSYWYEKKVELPIFNEFFVIYSPEDGGLSFAFKVHYNDDYTEAKYDFEWVNEIPEVSPAEKFISIFNPLFYI